MGLPAHLGQRFFPAHAQYITESYLGYCPQSLHGDRSRYIVFFLLPGKIPLSPFSLTVRTPSHHYSDSYQQRLASSVLELCIKGTTQYMFFCFCVNQVITFNCCALFPCMNTLKLDYLGSPWQTSGLFPLGGYYKQSSCVQVFLQPFLLGIYLHVELPAQRVRPMCNFGSNSYTAFGKAAPPSYPQWLSWSASSAVSQGQFLLKSCICGQ